MVKVRVCVCMCVVHQSEKHESVQAERIEKDEGSPELRRDKQLDATQSNLLGRGQLRIVQLALVPVERSKRVHLLLKHLLVSSIQHTAYSIQHTLRGGHEMKSRENAKTRAENYL